MTQIERLKAKLNAAKSASERQIIKDIIAALEADEPSADETQAPEPETAIAPGQKDNPFCNPKAKFVPQPEPDPDEWRIPPHERRRRG